MKKFIFFLCCLASTLVTAYMCYESWLLINARSFKIHDIAWMLGTLGWVVICFNIITRQYRWTVYLCK